MISLRNNQSGKVHLAGEPVPYSRYKRTKCGVRILNKYSILAETDNIDYVDCGRCTRDMYILEPIGD